jgi:hypothetical protein
MTYLQGYLASIPEWEKAKIVEELNKLYIEDNDYNISLNEEYSLATDKSVVDFDVRPSTTYNSVFYNVEKDINTFNSLINALHNSIENLDSLIEAIFMEMDIDITELQKTIRETKLKLNYNEESIEDDFSSSLKVEQPTLANEYLFQDRDGASLLQGLILDNQLTLIETKTEDLLHKENGKIKAKILLKDYRGPLVDSINTIDNAIDYNSHTYWEASSFMLNKLEMPYKEFSEHGHYVEAKILLPKMALISVISLSHSSAFPINICDIYVDGIPVLESPITITKNISIPLTEIYGEEISIIFFQPNYTLEDIEINDKEKDIDSLFNKAYGIKEYSKEDKTTFEYYAKKYYSEIKNLITQWKAGKLHGQ